VTSRLWWIKNEQIINVWSRFKLQYNKALCGKVSLVAKWGTNGEEGPNRRRFLYESGRKRLLRFDPSTTSLPVLNASIWECLDLQIFCQETWREETRGDSRYTRFRYPRFRISAVLFQFCEEHQYPIRGQILNPITCVEPSPGLSWNVMQMIGLASNNSGASLTSKWRLLCFQIYASPIYEAICRNATPVYNESHLYLTEQGVDRIIS
jgi:hypothetical protein